MKINKTLQFAIHFAHCSKKFNIEPDQLAELINLIKKSVAAYNRHDFDTDKKLCDKAQDIAKKHGFKLDWNGLYPWIIKEQSSIDIRQMLPMDE